jgi:hypothetical protein
VEFKGMIDGPEILLFQEFLFLVFEALLDLDTLDRVTADADKVMVMIVGPFFISFFSVTELQLADNSLSFKKIDLAINRGLVNIDIDFSQSCIYVRGGKRDFAGRNDFNNGFSCLCHAVPPGFEEI